MPSHNPRTIAEAIDVCRQRLRGISGTPWLDARLLTQHVTGLDASAVIAYGDAALDARRRSRLFDLTERRAAGEPVAYLIGHKGFCGLEIAVDRRALVPRPETEELVALCVEDWKGKAPAIAELGTGGGAIACALAHLLPNASITAGDSSIDALELAAHNVNALGFGEQVTLVHSDLFDAFPQSTYDVIIANLPYVAMQDLKSLEPQVQEHEPHDALFAGADGLDTYRRLLEQAPARISTGGTLYFECGPYNALALGDQVRQAFPGAQVSVHRDAAGLERMVRCSTGSS
ncbi:MAG: peptide chain release factor N(5)-glutamine methyltransferase [Candidatus Eremiobacteraeota bacterium]|nr:peptide chain release factor N(5)-glutamine methyltransferase [Candidatus Eremiobacteraeota bacterium]